MSLVFVLRVNDEPIGRFVAQRQEREIPADRVCTYDVMVDHMGAKSRVTVRHNFDAGALALVRTALAAALSAPSEPVQDQPRMWELPTIPADVRAVRDAEGRVWRREPKGWRRDTSAWTEKDLLLLLAYHPRLSPLTEVVNTDGD